MSVKKYIWSLIAVMALAIFPGMHSNMLAAPKPAIVPPPGTWQLDIQFHGPPQQFQYTLPGETQSKTYWYLLYSITNNTGADVDFYPQFELFTDTFKLSTADIKPRKELFEFIRKRYEKILPLLESQSQITGPILQGADNERDSVVIFDDFDPNANAASIFISGLSNEAVTVDHPVDIDPKTKKPRKVLLRKTLMMQYQIPGDALSPENRVMLYRDRKWVMR